MPARARIRREPVGQDRADAAVLPLVDDRKRDVGVGAAANQPGNPDRLAVGERDEHMVIRVDAGQLLEVGGAQRRLRAAEPEQAGPRSEPVEDRLDDPGLAPPERPDRDSPDHFRVHRNEHGRRDGPPHRPDGPSCRMARPGQ